MDVDNWIAKLMVELFHTLAIVVSNSLISMYAKCGNLQNAEFIFSLRAERDIVSWTSMITAYSQVGNITKAREFFDGMSTRNVITWNAMLGAFIQHGVEEDGLKMYSAMLSEKDVIPDWVTYVTLFRGCADIGANRLDDQIIGHAVKLGLILDTSVANANITMYSKCGRISEARKLFDFLNGKDLVSWNAMITGYSQDGMGKQAIEIFDDMLSKGGKPDYISYVAALSACSHSGLVQEGKFYLDDALLAVKEMRECGIQPSVVCYNALINGYGMLGRMEEARELVCEMEAKGVKPDVVTYSTILNGYGKIGDTDSAFQLNRQMLKKGVLPATITYSSLIRGLCEERRLNDACELFEKMLQLGLQPDEFTYTTLIAGHCREGDVEKALSLHDEMIKKGVLPDVVTYSVLINGLSKSACTKGAQRLLFKLYYEDPVPANIKYDALMHCCSKAEFKSVVALLKGFCMKGLMNEADKVYQSMLDRNWNLDGSVYSVLIHGHCRGGNVSKALSFHKQMLRCGFSPNSTSTISLVRGLFEEGMTVEADNVIQELLNCCSLEDAETSKALIDLNRKEGNVDAVVDVLCGMTRGGLLPAQPTYGILQENGSYEDKEDAPTLPPLLPM